MKDRSCRMKTLLAAMVRDGVGKYAKIIKTADIKPE